MPIDFFIIHTILRLKTYLASATLVILVYLGYDIFRILGSTKLHQGYYNLSDILQNLFDKDMYGIGVNIFLWQRT